MIDSIETLPLALNLDTVHLFSPGQRQIVTCAVVLLCHFLPTYQVLTHFKTLMHVHLNFSTCLFFSFLLRDY